MRDLCGTMSWTNFSDFRLAETDGGDGDLCSSAITSTTGKRWVMDRLRGREFERNEGFVYAPHLELPHYN
ncbi:hypothetical protein [Bythopirellula goksoeyrii]|uniref:hypothetical protein n=1 Tax=Bythopirellula goksoeyrii TaxID=1400387 RepID=UPI0011CE0D5C|nr:hypothetical protein [Bythopirellula goksoeyrii]